MDLDADGWSEQLDGWAYTRAETIAFIKKHGRKPQDFFDKYGNHPAYLEAIILNWLGV